MGASECSRPYGRWVGWSARSTWTAEPGRGAGRRGTKRVALRSIESLAEHPDHAANHADKAHVRRDDRFKGGVFGDQLDVAVAAFEALDRGVTVHHGDHDRAVGRLLLRTHQDEVAIQDARVDHALAPDLEQEETLLCHI